MNNWFAAALAAQEALALSSPEAAREIAEFEKECLELEREEYLADREAEENEIW